MNKKDRIIPKEGKQGHHTKRSVSHQIKGIIPKEIWVKKSMGKKDSII